LTPADVIGKKRMVLANVPCPEWGGDIWVRNISGTQRDEFDFWVQDHARQAKPMIFMRAKLVAMSWCDESGAPVTITEADVLKLSEEDAVPLDRLFEKCCQLSCLFGAV